MAPTTDPLASVFNSLETTEEIAKLEVVACEVVALVAVKVVRVEEAVETKPLLNSRVVDVAFSPDESLMKG